MHDALFVCVFARVQELTQNGTKFYQALDPTEQKRVAETMKGLKKVYATLGSARVYAVDHPLLSLSPCVLCTHT